MVTTGPNIDCYVRLQDGVEFRDVDGAPVIFNIESGQYFGLDEVGVEIWRGLEEGHTLREVIDVLLNRFAVSRGQCETDVLEFVKELCNKRLVVIV
jgi:Coenzyme PQQ synthesis protein D (PqqD)